MALRTQAHLPQIDPKAQHDQASALPMPLSPPGFCTALLWSRTFFTTLFQGLIPSHLSSTHPYYVTACLLIYFSHTAASTIRVETCSGLSSRWWTGPTVVLDKYLLNKWMRRTGPEWPRRAGNPAGRLFLLPQGDTSAWGLERWHCGSELPSFSGLRRL